MWSQMFLEKKFVILKGCPTIRAAFLFGQSAPYNQLFIQLTSGTSYVIFWKPNGLSKRLKGYLSDSFGHKYKCKISSYMDNTKVCYYVVDLILDSIPIILVFYCKFCACRIIPFYCKFLIFFYLKISKPDIHNKIIGVSSFQTGLNAIFSSAVFILRSKP